MLESRSFLLEMAVQELLSVFCLAQGPSQNKFNANDTFEAVSNGSALSGSSEGKSCSSGTLGAAHGTGDMTTVDQSVPKGQQTSNRQDEGTEFKEYCDTLVSHINHLTFDALVKATRDSLDALRKCFFFPRYYFNGSK